MDLVLNRVHRMLFALFISVAISVLVGCGGGTSSGSGTSGTTNNGGTNTGTNTGGSNGGSTAATHFAYVQNGGGSITGFTEDGNTGALTKISGSPFSAPTHGGGEAIVGSTLYLAGGYPNETIQSYSIGSDGKLTPLTSSTTFSEEIVFGLFAAGSNCLFATDGGGGVWGWKVGSNGSVTPVANNLTSLGPNSAITVSPDGRYLFLSIQQFSGAGSYEGRIFSIDSNACTLTANISGTNGLSVTTKTPQRLRMTVDPSNKYLFIANPIDNNILAYTYNANGTLTAVPGSPFKGQGAMPFSLVATSSTLYVGDFSEALIYGYSIGSNGALTPVPGSPWKNVMTPAYSMTVDPTGKFLYVANSDPGSISAWSIGTGGALTQISGSPFSTPEMFGANPSFIVFK